MILFPQAHTSLYVCSVSRQVLSRHQELKHGAPLVYMSKLCIPLTKVIDRYQVSIYYLILCTNLRIWTPQLFFVLYKPYMPIIFY